MAALSHVGGCIEANQPGGEAGDGRVFVGRSSRLWFITALRCRGGKFIVTGSALAYGASNSTNSAL